MILSIALKELYNNLVSSRFVIGFLLCLFLIPFTMMVSINDYLRYMNNWNDLHAYQDMFLTYFKDKDAADQDSPHWYNPYEDLATTRKPVNFEEVPLYTERAITMSERFSALSMYLTVMMLYTVVIFFLSFGLFVRYDVR